MFVTTRICLLLTLSSSLYGCTYVQDTSIIVGNRTAAEVAWLRTRPGSELPLSMRRHYANGFVDGYADVAAGADGSLPLFPPQRYWSTKYKTSTGREQVNVWFHGYEAGAAAAFADGIAGSNKLQTSWAPAGPAPIAALPHAESDLPAQLPPAVEPSRPADELLPPTSRRPLELRDERPSLDIPDFPATQPLPKSHSLSWFRPRERVASPATRDSSEQTLAALASSVRPDWAVAQSERRQEAVVAESQRPLTTKPETSSHAVRIAANQTDSDSPQGSLTTHHQQPTPQAAGPGFFSRLLMHFQDQDDSSSRPPE